MNFLALIGIMFRKTQQDWSLPVIFISGMMALMALIIWAAAREQRKRREALTQFGLENGFMYCEQPDAVIAEELAQIQVGPCGYEKRARFRNVLRGSVGGLDTIIADRTVGSGKSQSTSTIVAFKFGTAFPMFTLCGENVLWHIAEKLGYSDIDIDGAPDFSSRFFLHGQDQAAIRELFKPEVTQAFAQMDKDKAPYIAGAGQWLVICHLGRGIPPKDLRDFLQQAQSVAGAFRRAQTSSVFR
jgi:hypothetical protein